MRQNCFLKGDSEYISNNYSENISSSENCLANRDKLIQCYLLSKFYERDTEIHFVNDDKLWHTLKCKTQSTAKYEKYL